MKRKAGRKERRGGERREKNRGTYITFLMG